MDQPGSINDRAANTNRQLVNRQWGWVGRGYSTVKVTWVIEWGQKKSKTKKISRASNKTQKILFSYSITGMHLMFKQTQNKFYQAEQCLML